MLVRFLLMASLLWKLVPLQPVETGMKPDQMGKEEIAAFVLELYQARSRAMVTGQFGELEKFYMKTERSSLRALNQEKNRTNYILAWARMRNIILADAESKPRITRLSIHGDLARLSLIHSQKVSYSYSIGGGPQWFGVGTRHALTLKKIDDRWTVLKEWYLDPFEEKVELIPESGKRFPMWVKESQDTIHSTNPEPKRSTRYHRQNAINYALKYAGAAWGAGNGGRYNKAYRDYTGVGGDCTNFTSQAIGDPVEGGGLRMSYGWRYWRGSGGSHSWVQTDRFYHFIIHSGYGQLVGSGTFAQITETDSKRALGKLQPGDLIGFILHGDDVDHFSLVVGHDGLGYPLVNSHTADRYRMPFDLGWDRTTKYLLVHIRD